MDCTETDDAIGDSDQLKNTSSVIVQASRLVDGELTPMEVKFKRGDVKFSGFFWQDFVFYLQNNHVLLAICFAHPENPFNNVARLLAFITSLVFGLILACISITNTSSSKSFYLRLFLNTIIFVVVQAFFDINAQYINTCECIRHKGMPVK